MNFSEALELAKKGSKISRSGWNGKDLFVKVVPDQSCCNGAWLGFYMLDRLITPWTASQSDLLGEDWVVVE